MENVVLINFVLKRFQNMVLIMFMFAVHVSQMVGGVHKIVNASHFIATVLSWQKESVVHVDVKDSSNILYFY